MASKKGYVTLSMGQRMKVLEDLKTLPIVDVATKYNVNKSTIRRIKQNAVKIMEFADKSKGQKKRQRIKRPVHEELEHQLLTWFKEKRAIGDFISDALLLEKAVELRDTMGSCSNFKASEGWLNKFKKRHDIRLARTHRESSSADEDAAKKFIEDFQTLMEEEDIMEQNIYNMGETGLFWRALPSKTLTETTEKSVKVYKSSKERIAIALCTNASGTHKLMPLVIYKFQNPRALKHHRNGLPVVFKSQRNAWMTQSLFADWYENDFKPSVREHQVRNSIVGKVILLLHNCGGYELTTKTMDSENFKIVYLQPNTTNIIQPMNQGIIAKTKILYRHKIFRKAATYAGRLNTFHKYYSIKDCIDLLNESWSEITEENIRNAWKKCTPSQTNMYHHDMQRDIVTFTGERFSEDDVVQFIAKCEEAESTRFIEDDSEDKDEEANEDNEDEEQGLEENRRLELQYLFQQLNEYVSKETPFIQHIFEAFRNYFLGTNK